MAAAADLLAWAGPALGAEDGLIALAGKVATALTQAGASKLLPGGGPLAWRVVHAVVPDEQVTNVMWDELGRLVVDAIVNGIARHFAIAGVQRGSTDPATGDRVRVAFTSSSDSIGPCSRSSLRPGMRTWARCCGLISASTSQRSCSRRAPSRWI